MRVAVADGVGDVPGLDGMDAEGLVEREGGVHLAFVVLDAARGLVVDDQCHALGLGVVRHLGEIVSGLACVKEKALRFLIQSPSQPTFHPSTSTPPKPFAAAKSMYSLARAVVAPCFAPVAQV